MSDGGKGSKARPFSVSHEEWSSRWDAIFGRDQENDLSKVLPKDDVASSQSGPVNDSGSHSQ